MTIVRTEIPEGEFRLLKQLAAGSGQPMNEFVRDAIHAYFERVKVDSRDLVFRLFPLGESGRRGHRVAENLDARLYHRRSQ